MYLQLRNVFKPGFWQPVSVTNLNKPEICWLKWVTTNMASPLALEILLVTLRLEHRGRNPQLFSSLLFASISVLLFLVP